MAHLEGRLGRPIPAQALMRAVEITIMLAQSLVSAAPIHLSFKH